MSESNQRSIFWKKASQKKSDPANECHAPDPKRGFGFFAALVTIIIQKSASQKQGAKAEKEWEQKWRKREVRGIWAAAAIGLVAIIYSSVDSYENRKIMQYQLDEMKVEQRPWIGLSGLGPHKETPKPTAGRDFFMFVNWADLGKSPAFHVKANFTAKLLTAPQIPQLQPSCSTCGEGDTMLPNVPAGRTPHIAGAELTSEDIAQIVRGEKTIWLIGRIDYRDADDKPHKTLICYSFAADGSFISCGIPGSNYAD